MIILFVLCWVILGLFGQGLFMYGMKKKYPDQPYNWDLFPIQLVFSMLAGPVVFLVLIVIFDEEM